MDGKILDVKSAFKVRVIEYRCGNGKILYSSEVKPDTARKVSDWCVRTQGGIKRMELKTVDRDWFNKLKPEQLAVLEIGA